MIGAEKTAARQLRAYVFVADAEITGLNTASPQLQIIILNTGQTPAYDVVMSTRVKPFNADTIINFEKVEEGPDSSRFIFGPNAMGRRNIPLQFLTNPGALDTLQHHGAVMYAWGRLTYRDEFESSRITEFCLEIGGEHGWPSDNKMAASPHGNSAC